MISSEIKDKVSDENVLLQLAVKAVNATAGPNGLVPTFLVFGAYPRMMESDPPSSGIIERAKAVKEAIKEVRTYYATRKVSDVFRMRNGPRTEKLYSLSLNAEVLVWREKHGWKGPFKMLSIDGNTCIVELPSGPTRFRSTVVKPYYTIVLVSLKLPI